MNVWLKVNRPPPRVPSDSSCNVAKQQSNITISPSPIPKSLGPQGRWCLLGYLNLLRTPDRRQGRNWFPRTLSLRHPIRRAPAIDRSSAVPSFLNDGDDLKFIPSPEGGDSHSLGRHQALLLRGPRFHTSFLAVPTREDSAKVYLRSLGPRSTQSRIFPRIGWWGCAWSDSSSGSRCVLTHNRCHVWAVFPTS